MTSSHLPPLLETSDPFELLGVTARDADKRSLRRAYVRLIKVYRPERAPEEFQRIRGAYEAALEQLAWRALVAPREEAEAHEADLVAQPDQGASQPDAAADGQRPTADKELTPVTVALHGVPSEGEESNAAATARLNPDDEYPILRLAVKEEDLTNARQQADDDVFGGSYDNHQADPERSPTSSSPPPVRLSLVEAEPPIEPSDAPPKPTSDTPQTGLLALARAQAAWREGDAEATFAAAREACRDHPHEGDCWWLASRSLLASGGEPVNAHAWLLRGLQAGAPLATRLLTELPAHECDQFVANPGLSWELLSRQPARNAALGLLRSRLEELLCHDQVEQAVEEVSAPAFVRASVSEPELEPIALRVVAVAAWEHDEDAADLYRQFQSNVTDDWELRLLHDRIAHAAHLSRDLPARDELPVELRRLLMVLPVVDERRRLRCVQAAALAARTFPHQWLNAFDALKQGDSDLLFWLHDLLDQDEEEDDELEDGERLLDTLIGAQGASVTRQAEAEIERLTPLMRRLDKAISAARINSVQNFGIGLILLSVIPAIRLLHWWAIGYGIAAFIGLILLISVLDDRLYRAVIRPKLGVEVASKGTRPLLLIAWIKIHSKWSDNIGRFDTEISDDDGLRMLARLARLARQDE